MFPIKRIKAFSLGILSLILIPYTLADVLIGSGATLTVNGKFTSEGPVKADPNSTLAGNGTVITEYIHIGNSALLSPGSSIGLLTADSDVIIDGSYSFEIDGSTSDTLMVSGVLDISNTTLSTNILVAGSSPPAFVIASYGTLKGGTFSSYSGIPAGYTFDYAYFDGISSKNIALVQSPTAYVDWALNNGLTLGVNDGFDDDPNGDGNPNIEHFALDTDPLGLGGSAGKQREAIYEFSGEKYLSFTFPVHTGAAFSGAGTNPTMTVNGIVYTIHGDDDLTAPSLLPIDELTPALSSGLPALSAGYEYRTFNLFYPLSDDPSGFIIVELTPAP